MIDIQEVWVPQMLWYCELIADDKRLAWAFNQEPDRIWTSVTDYDELMEQIFDDLDALGMLPSLAQSPIEDGLKITLETFVSRLAQFDERKGEDEFDNKSPAWLSVKAAAADAITAAKNSKANNAQTH